MEENPGYLGPHSFLRPIGVCRTQPSCLHLARGPVKLLSQMQLPFAGQRAKYFNLLGASLFVGQHFDTIAVSTGPGKGLQTEDAWPTFQSGEGEADPSVSRDRRGIVIVGGYLL